MPRLKAREEAYLEEVMQGVMSAVTERQELTGTRADWWGGAMLKAVRRRYDDRIAILSASAYGKLSYFRRHEQAMWQDDSKQVESEGSLIGRTTS